MRELSSCEKLRDVGWPNVAALDRANRRGWRRQEHAMRERKKRGGCVIESSPSRRNCESHVTRAIPIASRIPYDNDDSDFPREQAVCE